MSLFISVQHGRRAGDARLHVEHAPLIGRIQADVARILRARPDEAHVANQGVDELRQLVEFRFGEERGRLGVTRGSSWPVMAAPVFARSGTMVRNLYRVKTRPPLPDAAGPMNTGPGELSLTATAIQGEHRADQDERRERQTNVQQPRSDALS